jgi:hypothetical protein
MWNRFMTDRSAVSNISATGITPAHSLYAFLPRDMKKIEVDM